MSSHSQVQPERRSQSCKGAQLRDRRPSANSELPLARHAQVLSTVASTTYERPEVLSIPMRNLMERPNLTDGATLV